ncbi:ATP-dependent DNA helicase RecG [Caloramator quimbayensis]|uniref:ATP-dependent DNA helicase RecG n=1 Tax=Caloramator quimbayensis TaxID=1147123 RepID=A0A1T4XRZ0_9CLOT|nr:ATP-dependent DNA helicase RecG [Caloramator quimbayensis]SKA92319.1 ATP-dependent DNA helicase RecG [Caloramator quimbayensis]
MDIKSIKGVGEKTLKYLNSLGIYTVKDAILYFPRSYEDRRNIKPINELKDGDIASIIADVSLIYANRRASTGKTISRVVFKNQTGFIVGVWFNQPYIKNTFKIGQRVFLYGKISKKMGEVQIIEPQYEKDIEDIKFGINPIYPSNKHLSQKVLRKIIDECLKYIDSEINEILPDDIRKQKEIYDIKKAILNIHHPNDYAALDKSIERIKFEELLILQLGLFAAKKRFEKLENAYPIPVCSEMKEFKESLPFELTNAQSKTIREILIDMKKSKPMNRLVQGDVGSGKTIVAIIALFNCAMNKYQGALMAPTEILAQQHFLSLKSLLKNYSINIALLIGSTPKKQKVEIIEKIKKGEIDIVVGTHALIQENVEFKNLALVITDEQHRFGVRQRGELINKGHNPHVLVMTATPIPRTLALFVYGDMDISIINEMPSGRQKIDTYFVRPSMRDRVYDFVKKEIKNGRQAYIVCPLVEESEKLEAESAVETYEKLKEVYFKKFNVGLIHGKMNSIEKDLVMNDFKNKEIDILVSTTVIEVGINVPNATIIVIENADRFGLAQLHQLRGRVGRGSYKSYCILISEAKTDEARKRLKIMTQNSDGFIIAEKDMELRGTGEFFGTKQHGPLELKLADPFKDIDILKQTRDLAREMLEKNMLYKKEYFNLIKEIENKFNAKIDQTTFN